MRFDYWIWFHLEINYFQSSQSSSMSCPMKPSRNSVSVKSNTRRCMKSRCHDPIPSMTHGWDLSTRTFCVEPAITTLSNAMDILHILHYLYVFTTPCFFNSLQKYCGVFARNATTRWQYWRTTSTHSMTTTPTSTRRKNALGARPFYRATRPGYLTSILTRTRPFQLMMLETFLLCVTQVYLHVSDSRCIQIPLFFGRLSCHHHVFDNA